MSPSPEQIEMGAQALQRCPCPPYGPASDQCGRHGDVIAKSRAVLTPVLDDLIAKVEALGSGDYDPPFTEYDECIRDVLAILRGGEQP